MSSFNPYRTDYFQGGLVSERIKKIDEDLFRLPSEEFFPDFVINNEIRKRGIAAGDYKPQLDRRWSRTNDYYRFDFDTNVVWDCDKANELGSIIRKYPRWEQLYPKREYGDRFMDLLQKREPQITLDMISNHFLILDKMAYEKGGLKEMLEIVERPNYKPYSYYDPYAEEGVEGVQTAKSYLPERLAAAINSNSITANFAFLRFGYDLLEEIGRNFFGAKAE